MATADCGGARAHAAGDGPPGPAGARAGQPVAGTGGGVQTPVPQPATRHSRVRIRVTDMPVAKSTNLQPYLWKVLQGVDIDTKLSITVEVESAAGVPEDVLNGRIVEGLEQLGIQVEWEA